MLRDGDVKKNLTSAPIAPKSLATADKLRALHPKGEPVKPPASPLQPAPIFSSEVVRSALCSFNPCAAGGLFGYKPALLQQCVKAESFHFLNTLTDFVNMLANGCAPTFLKPFIAGGSSIALKKGQDGVRPLCSGDPIRRLVAKCFCLGGKDEINEVFQGKNYGVGCPGGVEVVAHSLRNTLELLGVPGTTKALLKIDFKNAFNMVDRNALIDSSCELFPGMSRWTYWCYDQPSLLLYAHEHELESRCGTQQGDPLGPLYFCCPLQAIIEEIALLEPNYNKWYMDDGGIVAEPELLIKVWAILVEKGPPLGMILNARKSEWSWLDPNKTDPCPIIIDGPKEAQIAMVPTDEIQMLGVPLGSDDFVAEFVGKVLGKARPIMDMLATFEDTQVAYFLLRSSYSIVRATHFMRTTPPGLWEEQADSFDESVRSTAETILGFPMSEDQYAQASTSSSVGGLSLRKCSEHALGAYAASWNESSNHAREAAWTSRADIAHCPPMNQKTASHEVDVAKIEALTAKSSPRSARHLERLQCPHANAWLSAVPSYVDGVCNVLPPNHFQVAVRRLLSVAVLKDEAPCPFCKQTMNKFGDHALCCRSSGDNITRHNRLRNLVDKIAGDALLSPVMEKKGILGQEEKDSRRPGDVTVPVWAKGKGLAIDVAVISPLVETNMRHADPCEEYATAVKHAKYDEAFVGSTYDFSAMIFETSGAVNAEGESILKQLFRFAAKRVGDRYSSYTSKAWIRISINIQHSVAQSILNRSINHEPGSIT